MSGRFDCLPSSTIRLNSGDSLSLSRIQRETASRIADSKKGSRQPQSPNASSPMLVRMPRISRSARKRPSVAVV